MRHETVDHNIKIIFVEKAMNKIKEIDKIQTKLIDTKFDEDYSI